MPDVVPIPRRTFRVLVVDDEPRLRDALVDLLPEMGFEAAAARSAEEALRMMAADERDIVLLDLQLPGMHGLDCFHALREKYPHVQVIIITGFGDIAVATQAIHLDVVDFVTKPYHLRTIEEALDRARRRIDTRVNESFADNSGDVIEPPPTGSPTLADIERRAILEALERNAGNRSRTAKELGVSRRTLHSRLRAYGRAADDEQD